MVMVILRMTAVQQAGSKSVMMRGKGRDQREKRLEKRERKNKLIVSLSVQPYWREHQYSIEEFGRN